jgi:hypothetical protein
MPDNFGRMTKSEAPKALQEFCFPGSTQKETASSKQQEAAEEIQRLRGLLSRCWDMVHEVSTDYYTAVKSEFNPKTGTYIEGEKVLACAECHRYKGNAHRENCIVADAEELLKDLEEFK